MATELETLKSMYAMLGTLIAAKEGTPPVEPAPPAPAGYVAMPVTGHVLPLPDEAKGDHSLWGYMMRISPELGLPSPAPKRLSGIAAAWAGDLPNGPQHRDKWPEAADRAANPKAYMTPEELEKYLADEASGKTGPWVPTPKPPGGGVVDVPIPG